MRTLLLSLTLSCLAACNGPPGTCVVGGKTYKIGETFPAPDGCNTCTCLAEGAACTEIACPPPPDGGVDGSDVVVMCGGVTGTFPAFDKRCAAPADCEIAFHQINCCGSEKALGINKAEHDRFTTAEATCRGQYPGCGCAAMPPVAEDGKSSMNGGPDIAVDCRAGACATYIP